MYKSERITERLRVAQMFLLVLACLWGVDYMMEPPKTSLYVAERMIISLPLWGSFFLLFGLVGLLGEWWMEAGRNKTPSDASVPYICQAENRWWPSFGAHAALCAMYASLGAGCVVEMTINRHWHGMRMVGGMATIAVGHWVFAQRRRHAP